MAILTKARKSLWDAIDNWPELQCRIGQTIRMDEEESMLDELEPSISELPCIAIVPTSITPEWWTHKMQKWPYVLTIRIWTKHFSLPEAEELIEIVGDAIFQATFPGSNVPIVKAATGYYPDRIGPITVRPAALRDGADGSEGTRVIMSEITVALRLNKDPFGS